MYILPNGVKITEETCDILCEAIVEDDGKRANFLEAETGLVIEIPKAHKRKLAYYEQNSRLFYPVPHVKIETRAQYMREFLDFGIANLPAGTRGRLLRMLDHSPDMATMEKILANAQELEAWWEWEYYMLFDLMQEWLFSSPINAKEDEEYWLDDDCPLCQMMREGKV